MTKINTITPAQAASSTHSNKRYERARIDPWRRATLRRHDNLFGDAP